MFAVTEVKIERTPALAGRVLRAFASVVIDDSLAVRDLRIIEGDRGLFVAMPSRKLADKCPKCSYKNYLDSRFCNYCGERLADDRALPAPGGGVLAVPDGRPRRHTDVAYPINPAARRVIHEAVMSAYHSVEAETVAETQS